MAPLTSRDGPHTAVLTWTSLGRAVVIDGLKRANSPAARNGDHPAELDREPRSGAPGAGRLRTRVRSATSHQTPGRTQGAAGEKCSTGGAPRGGRQPGVPRVLRRVPVRSVAVRGAVVDVIV